MISRPFSACSGSTSTPSSSIRGLVGRERLAHRRLDRGERGRADLLEDEVVDAAAEARPHHALAGRGLEDDPDRLADVALVARHRDVAGERIDRDRIAQPTPRKSRWSERVHVSLRSAPSARPSRSRWARRPRRRWSPCRAAGRPPISTVALPLATTPPTCGLSAVDERADVRVAAGAPGRLAADQHRRGAGAGPERRAVAGRVADAGGGCPIS